MAALDDILGGSPYAGVRKPLQTAPPAIDPSLQGASNSVGSQPVVQSTQKPTSTPQAQAPGADATKVVGKPGEAPQGAEKPPMTYVEMFQMFNPERPETTVEKAKREKREKAEAALAAVGDGISALSNLWFTSQYAPNSYDPSKGMSAVTKDRWDKLRQEREANRRAYSEGYMRARAIDEANEKEERNWRHTIEREKALDARADKKEEREDRKAEQNELMFQLKYALQAGRLTEQAYRTAIAEVKAGKIEELTEAQIRRLNRTGTGGTGGGRGRERAPGEYPWYDKDGNLHYAHDYQAMRQNAILNGTWSEDTQESTSSRVTKTSRGTVKSSSETTTRRQGKGHSSAPAPKGGVQKGQGKWDRTKEIKW